MDFESNVGRVVGYGIAGKPSFWVRPLTTSEAHREVHIAFQAPNRAAVPAFFTAAVPSGALCCASHASGPSTTRLTMAPSSVIRTETTSKRSATLRDKQP
jgi:hypothetical protein